MMTDIDYAKHKLANCFQFHQRHAAPGCFVNAPDFEIVFLLCRKPPKAQENCTKASSGVQ
jgi:hypothetical protein